MTDEEMLENVRRNMANPCTNCGGSGGIQMRDKDGNVIAEIICPACSGTGEA